MASYVSNHYYVSVEDAQMTYRSRDTIGPMFTRVRERCRIESGCAVCREEIGLQKYPYISE